MPRKTAAVPKQTICKHESLQYIPSLYAQDAGYVRPSSPQREAAITPAGQAKTRKFISEEDPLLSSDLITQGAFPAALILPNDGLALDPTYPAQSLRSWIREKDRNEVTTERRTIYVAAPPRADSSVKQWTTPILSARTPGEDVVPSPGVQDVIDYLSAFYHPLPVKLLPPENLQLSPWVEESAAKKAKARTTLTAAPSFIGFQTKTEVIQIRIRRYRDGVFPQQLNLNDLIDAAISIIPDDAYSLLLLVDHDMYEDEDDDFVCGRAYGGSSVAVISTARYNPILDALQEVGREHDWPASHCKQFLEDCGGRNEVASNTKAYKKNIRNTTSSLLASNASKPPTPLKQAVSSLESLPSLGSKLSPAALYGLWLGRVCRTSGHELGHCFGMDHCVYYACSMQGTASLAEDNRQPPYLCPVDEAKMIMATGTGVQARYRALLEYCQTKQEAHLFVAFGSWLRARLEETGRLDSSREGRGASVMDPIELD